VQQHYIIVINLTHLSFSLWGPSLLPVAISPTIKGLEREDDHSPPSTAKIKDTWSYTSSPHTLIIRAIFKFILLFRPSITNLIQILHVISVKNV
jgi:hypothetical protein